MLQIQEIFDLETTNTNNNFNETLNATNSFFVFDRDVVEDMTEEVIWKTIIRHYPKLSDNVKMKPLDLKKEILEFFKNEMFVDKLIEHYECDVKYLVKIMITHHSEAFTKYLLVRLSPILKYHIY